MQGGAPPPEETGPGIPVTRIPFVQPGPAARALMLFAALSLLSTTPGGAAPSSVEAPGAGGAPSSTAGEPSPAAGKGDSAPGKGDSDAGDRGPAAGAPGNHPESAAAIEHNTLCHMQFFGGGSLEQAIYHCTRALEVGGLPEEDIVTALVNRGIAYKLTGNLDAAIADYTAALARAPEAGDIFATRANAYLEMSLFDAAITDAHRAIELSPDYAPAYFVRGRIYEALGQRALARDDFLKAYELAPDNPDIAEKAWAYGANQDRARPAKGPAGGGPAEASPAAQDGLPGAAPAANAPADETKTGGAP